MCPKVIFDRSAFHGENFKLLTDSSLVKCVNKNLIHVFHVPVFLEETLQILESEDRRQELSNHLNFIFKICNKAWFDEWSSIVQSELAELKPNILMAQKVRKNGEKYILQEVGGGYKIAESKAAVGVAVNKEKQEKWKGIGNEMRKYVASERKRNPSLKGKTLTFKQYLDAASEGKTNLIYYGEIFIKTVLGGEEDKISTWSNNPEKFLYATSIIQAHLYVIYHAMLMTNSKIDKNAGRDVELLFYLNFADIVVSNDISFMKDAFDELWASKGKEILTTGEFIKYLETLQ